MLIELKKIDPVAEDTRGNAYAFPIKNRDHITVINRKAGTTSGNHYHPGTTQSKSPESFYLAKGRLQLLVKDVSTQQEETYLIEENTWFAIPANIYHVVTAVTDIVLLEFNLVSEDFKVDVVR
ncbi:hypothetical protein EXS71_04080 [Candidatus Uhrbacteria bacterium]|nr:hypothetical protein [Candidatus Uhrbacteria bacterium]